MGYVLLLEGHKFLRSALSALLEQSGYYGVQEAADPLDGVRRILSRAPHIMVVDTIWPDIKGPWLCRFLRELAPHSRIVLLVDDGWQDSPEIAGSSGADAFVARERVGKELPPILAQWTPGADELTLAVTGPVTGGE